MEHRIDHHPHPALAATVIVLATLSNGCTVREEPAHAPFASVAAAPADSENSWTPQSPQEKWWERKTPCPEGTALVGDAPPKGFALECRSPDGKRNGRSSVWFESGHAGTYTEYENDVPHGRWLYWLHNDKLVEGYYDHGRRQGNWTYWFDGGAGFDMRSRWAARNARSYVVESYDRGLLVRTIHYRDGVPVE